jgi:DNA-binding transcriptional ArsR family regulator
MVKYQEAVLDRTFAALADPTRRELIAQLGTRGTVSVSELAAPLPISLPAVMKHLDVLSDAGLVTREKTGRVVSCRLAAEPMEEAMAWLSRHHAFWTAQLDRLAEFLEEDACQTGSKPVPASRSSAATKRRSRKSSPRSRTRKR